MSRETEVTLLSFGDADRAFHEGDLRVRILGEPWYVRGHRFNPVSARVLPEILRAEVVHCHQQHVLVSSLAALAGRLTGRRVFVTDLGGGGWDFSAYVKTDRWFHAHLHISQYSRSVYGQTDQHWSRVIFTGVDNDRFSPDPGVAKTGGALFVGRLLPHKGVDRLIEALPPSVSLDLAGPSVDAKYMGLLHELAVGKRVNFLGHLQDVELVAAYRRSRCVVLPSLYRDRYGNETRVPELMGQTLLEGMACGIPAICTDVASMPEAVVDGVTGFVVPPEDLGAMRNALLTLCNDHARAEAMGTAARARMLEHFQWASVVKRCLAAYRS
ncbi:MAG TPA: glycosyltransferase family 4 protein [Myxococcaceae bacterium]|nr:glycosyltransferase family 4 protein [Myxococcaceae bacterium]